MNWHQIAGDWKQYKGQVRERWGRLTDEDLEVIRGRREQLVGKIQERYGLSIKVVEKQIHEFFSALRTMQDAPSAAEYVSRSGS
jgi:uncharacterized protein YjbJ (UPF0337 family)